MKLEGRCEMRRALIFHLKFIISSLDHPVLDCIILNSLKLKKNVGVTYDNDSRNERTREKNSSCL